MEQALRVGGGAIPCTLPSDSPFEGTGLNVL